MPGHVMSHEQTARTIPEQILASSVLKMNAVELAQYVSEQVGENPALTLEEVDQCPLCGTPISDRTCPLCGASAVDLKSEPTEPQDDEWAKLKETAISGSDPDDDFDPFLVVASPIDLPDHLQAQVRLVLTDECDLEIAHFIIDALDEDGYFREDMYETATSFCASVPEFERVLAVVQACDPAGIAARDVKECLLLQLSRMDQEPCAELTARLIETCWDDLAKLKASAIAERLGVEVEDIQECMEFMRECLNPHPASLYRAPWAELAPSSVGQIVPDVVIRMRGNSPVVEVLDFQAGLIKLDDEYESASASDSGYSAEDRKHIKDYVDRARCILDAVQLRRQTLAKIAVSLADYQKDFLSGGPSRLKPLKQKELAAAIGVHESTVCRALNGKYARIPSGEVISFEVFFDASLPIKEMIRAIIASSEGQSLSDSEIAKRLAEQGVQIARRTVAKYRDQLRLPTFQLRNA